MSNLTSNSFCVPFWKLEAEAIKQLHEVHPGSLPISTEWHQDGEGGAVVTERILEFCDLVMGLAPSATGAVVCAEAPGAVLATSRLRFGDPDSIAMKRRRA